MAEAKKEESKPKKPLNVALIMQIVFAVVNFAIIGGGAFLVYKSTLGWHPPVVTESDLAEAREKHGDDDKISSPLIYTMDKFTVNLAGDPLKGEPKRTIRLEINLEMLGKEGFEEVINNDNRARARDRIVQLLNSKNFSELESIQGKLFLKDQIATEINSLLDEGVVKDIYFTDFVVQ